MRRSLKLRKESVGLGIRGPAVQYSLRLTFLNFLFSRSKGSDDNIGIIMSSTPSWLLSIMVMMVDQ